jgi:hypothetical protein
MVYAPASHAAGTPGLTAVVVLPVSLPQERAYCPVYPSLKNTLHLVLHKKHRYVINNPRCKLYLSTNYIRKERIWQSGYPE